MKNKVKTLDMFPSTNISLNDKFIWQIWVLKINTKGKSSIKLVYSWIIPCNSSQKGWQDSVQEFTHNISISQNKEVRIDLIRADYYGSGESIQNFIRGLLKGDFLNEVKTDETSPIPNSFLNLSLGENLSKIHSSFVIRPEVMLPINHLLVPWSHKATPNPTNYCIFVNQLFFLPKMSLLSFKDFDLNITQTKELINILCSQIKTATGFIITQESAPRLGNIEWYRMPVSDEDLNPLISYGSIKENNIANDVRIHFRPLPQGSKTILIRCRMINGEEVSLDKIKESQWSDSTFTVDFHSQQPVSEIEVTVWEKDSEGLATIIFNQSNICVRSISTHMSIVGSQINSGRINLLNKLAGKEEHKKSELAQYNRSTSASISEIGGYNDDPWVSSSRSVINFMKKIFPEKSKGQFFLNGWDQQKGESGQLSFIEWIFKLISGEKRGGLILFDPYFDKDAVEIFANARTTNTRYRVVTCTQHREKEEQIGAETKSTMPVNLTKAAQEIRDACEVRKALINNLDICISDLVSIGRGKQQLFHDRYLLLMDSEGQVEQGFHLSNSLQGATRKAPLLVTPIPDDILFDVYYYIENLLNPASDTASSKKTEILQIYPVPKVDDVPVTPIRTEPEITKESTGKVKDIPNSAFFFSQLIDDSSLEDATDTIIYKRLVENGLVGVESNSFNLYMITPVQWKNIIGKLGGFSQSDFNSFMSAFGECQARGSLYRHEKKSGETVITPSYDALAELITQIKENPQIADKLVSFISTFKHTPHFTRDRVRIYQIFNEPTFEKVLERTLDQLNHIGGDFFGIEYKFYFACKLLVKFP